MKCPKCNCMTHGSVIDSRPSGENGIRRRRRCECGFRYTSIEIIVSNTHNGSIPLADQTLLYEFGRGGMQVNAARGIDLFPSSLSSEGSNYFVGTKS